MGNTAIQYISYFFLGKFGLVNGKYFVLAMMLVGHLFIFPPFCMPDYSQSGPHCGMGDLAIYLLFWFVAVPCTIVSHIFYNTYFGKTKTKKEAGL